MRSKIAVRLSLATVTCTPQALLAQTCNVPVLPPITHTQTTTYTRSLVLLDPATYPTALCNDGSPGGYYFRQGVGSAVNRWVIYLEGAGDCPTAASCTYRRIKDTKHNRLPTVTGSEGYTALPPPHLTKSYSNTGILSTSPVENPTFYDANSVEIKECSSDWFTGAQAATKAGFSPTDMATWSFQGRAIVLAVVADLEAKYGLQNATEVMLTGDSSGGVGATLLINDVLPHLPPTARTVIAPAAGYTIDIGAYDKRQPAPYVSTASPTVDETQTAEQIALWNGRGDAVCDGQAVTPAGHSNCYNTSLVLAGNYIPVPAFVAQAQEDTIQLVVNGLPGGHTGAAGSTTSVYASNFAAQMRLAFATINPLNTVFAPDVNIHEMITPSAQFVQSYVFPNATTSAQSAMSAWYIAPCNQSVAIQPGG